MTEEQVFLAAAERLARRLPLIQLNVKLDSVMAIIGTMQLALRHPEIQPRTPHAALAARAVVDRLIEQLEQHEPVLGPILRRGYES